MSVSKYRTYPEYKDSGVEWLGMVPEHWEIKKLKLIISVLEAGVSVNSESEPIKSSEEIGILKTSCVYTGSFRAIENKKVIPEEIDRVKCPVKANSLIISRMNTPELVGAAAYVSKDYDNLFLPDRLWQSVFFNEYKDNVVFLDYLMKTQSFRKTIAILATGASASMKNIAKEDFLNIYIPLPRKEEKIAITSYLDKQTSKIDTIIKKQQELIEILKEKRQALISHAVTKGLNPDIEMKDSGVEWLGDVPVGWELVKAKYICKIFLPQRDTPELNEKGGTQWITSDLLTNKAINSNKVKYYINEEQLKLHKIRKVPANSVLATCLGKFSLTAINKIPVVISQHIQTFSFIKKAEVEFINYQIQSNTIKEYFERFATETTIRCINKEKFALTYLILPPIPEQKAIVSFLDQQTTKIDSLINKTTQAITLLKERRNALISAAVTGQIYVRDWVGFDDKD